MKTIGMIRNQTGLPPAPEVEGDDEEGKPGQQLVGGAEERPKDEASLAPRSQRPHSWPEEEQRPWLPKDDGKDGRSVLVPEEGQQAFAMRG